jgi:hypothetical protein
MQPNDCNAHKVFISVIEYMKFVQVLRGKTKTSSSSVTFRFDNGILNQLRDESDQKRISLNTLANQIFQSHVEYDTYASKAGMISFPKALLIRLIEALGEQEVEDLSKYIAKNDIKDMTLLLKKEYTLSSFLDTIESWLRVSGFTYRRDQDRADNNNHRTQTFVIQHDMGKRWSSYFERLFRYVFEDLNLRKYSFDNTDNSITFKIQMEE